MGLTLDQLLEATGVDELAGGHHKTASSSEVATDFAKLADLCREAADATPTDEVNARQRELVEKTAAVAIIQRTLEEIREIDGNPPSVVKTASVQPNHAPFIKQALEAGHSPEDIAQFLDNLVAGKKAAAKTVG
jgi:hypothetical protein